MKFKRKERRASGQDFLKSNEGKEKNIKRRRRRDALFVLKAVAEDAIII